MSKLLWSLTAQQLSKIVDGEVISDTGAVASGLATDTRDDMESHLFVALKGESFDAHDFLDQCLSRGAHCLLVHSDTEKIQALKQKISIVKVNDTLVALQRLATWWRRECGWKVLAITGSSGKTTTKEFLKHIVSQHGPVYANEKNFNNHWGVPFTLLTAPKDVKVVITEMGMNHLGEIEALCKIAEPDAVVCTMVGQAHIGELGSIENVARAKEEIYLNSPNALRVFNIDNDKTIDMYKNSKRRGEVGQITFSSFRSEADIQLRANEMSLQILNIKGIIQGVEGQANIPIIGRHNTVNISAAVGLALATGMSPEDIWRSLQAVKLDNWGRNQLVHLKNGTQVLFDGYNANPESMAVLVKNLFEIFTEGKKVAVLGDMLELGDLAQANHQSLGEMVANTDIEVVWFIGEHGADFRSGLEAAKFSKTLFISDTYEETLAMKIGSMLEPDDIVIVKGSRGMKLEQVVEAWEPLDFEFSS